MHLRNSLSSILNIHGYTSSTADSGKTALEALQSKHFELILLDLCMPGVDRHQVMRWIADKQLDTCIVVVSGDVSIDSAISALHHGTCDYLKKPYKLIAEGVEKADQYQLLHTLNCNEAQGFLFCKPLTSQDTTELLIKDPPLGGGAHWI